MLTADALMMTLVVVVLLPSMTSGAKAHQPSVASTDCVDWRRASTMGSWSTSSKRAAEPDPHPGVHRVTWESAEEAVPY